MNDAQVVIDYVIDHLLHNERTAMASKHVHPDDAAKGLEWYRRADIADPGIDPTQIVQRVPYVLQVYQSKALWPQTDLFRVSISSEALFTTPFSETVEMPDFESVRKEIHELFSEAHLVGCFKPYRFWKTGGHYVFNAEFLAWGCVAKELDQIAAGFAARHVRVSRSTPVMMYSKLKADQFLGQLLEVLSVPDRQFVDEMDFDNAYHIPMDFCAEIELKELLKCFPLSSQILSQGDGRKLLWSKAKATSWSGGRRIGK